MYLNKVIVAGNLTRDPDYKVLPSGTKACSFPIAINRYWKDAKTGERKEQTEFVDIIVYGTEAETSNTYLRKGDNATIEGRLQTRSYESGGIKKYKTEVIADRVQFGDKSNTVEEIKY